jgi:hypothetical protein
MMSQFPVEVVLEKKAQAVFTFTLFGTASGGLIALFCAGLGGFLGIVGAKLGGDAGDPGWFIGGALGTSLGVILLTRVLMWWPNCGIFGTALWFIVTAAGAGAISWYIEPYYRWPFLRWVIGGMLNGVLLAPMHMPRFFFGNVGDMPKLRGKEALAFAGINKLALLLSKFKHRLPGILVTGGLGSLFCSWFPALLLGIFADKDLEEIFKSNFTVALAAVFLSLVGGVVGGWYSWKQSLRPIQAELAAKKETPA